MTLSPDLSKLGRAEKDALIHALTEQVAAGQDACNAAQEARLDTLTRPPKTLANEVVIADRSLNRMLELGRPNYVRIV